MILIYCDDCDGRYEVKTSSLLIEQIGIRHGKAIYRLSARCPGCHENQHDHYVSNQSGIARIAGSKNAQQLKSCYRIN